MRILVVEDEPKAAQYFAKGLRENGFVVETTGRGDEAWRLIQHEPFDLVVLDVMLPGWDGCKVFSEHRRLPGQALRVFRVAGANSIGIAPRTSAAARDPAGGRSAD